MTALAGCTTDELRRVYDGYLNEIRRLTDVNGTWWWPYEVGGKRGQIVRRGPFACGWAEGDFSVLFPANLLGIAYDAPRSEFHFSPLPAIGNFDWNDFPMGTDHFSVSLHQGTLTFKNLSGHAVKFLAASLPVIEMRSGETVRLNMTRLR